MTLDSSTANRIPSGLIWTWTLGAKRMQLSSWKSCLAELETDLKIGGPPSGSPAVDMVGGGEKSNWYLEVLKDCGW